MLIRFRIVPIYISRALIAFGYVSLILTSCTDVSIATKNKDGEALNDSVEFQMQQIEQRNLRDDSLRNSRPGFELWRMNDSIKNTLKHMSPDSQALVAALNRIDASRIYRLDSIIVPKKFAPEWNWYSSFPELVTSFDSIHLILAIDALSQTFAAYEQGKLIHWGPVSLGKRSTQTPQGLFHTNWKAKTTVSTDNPEWILNWYFNLVNKTGVSMHEYDLQGYPASHSCIRLRAADAEWIYYKAQQWKLSENGRVILAYGTPVFIFGNYPFGKARPWYMLVNDSTALDINEDSLTMIIAPFKELIMTRQRLRDSLYP